MRKWLPKLVALLPIFRKFNSPCSEIGDGTKLWECFGNYFIHFLIFFDIFIRYFNPGISFVVFSLHISRGEINTSLDSNCIDIVTKFSHIRVVFFLTAIWFWLFNFGSFSRWQPHEPGDNHCVLTISTRRSLGASPQGWVPNPDLLPRGVWTGNLPILITTS